MYNSYLILLRLCREIKPDIKGKFLISVHSQNKNLFHLTIGEQLNSTDNIVLEFSAVAHSPYLLRCKYFKPAGRNLIYFFRENLPQRIVDIRIAFAERIIMLILESGYLFITLRGKDSNIFCSDHSFSSGLSVRKTELKLKDILGNDLEFIEPDKSVVDRIHSRMNSSNDSLSEMTFLGKELLRELKASGSGNPTDLLNGKVVSVLTDKLLLVRNAISGSLTIRPESFFNDEEVIAGYNDAVSALQEFVAQNRKQASASGIRKQLLSGVKKDLEFNLLREEKLNDILNSEDRSAFYDKAANLLMINRDTIPSGSKNADLIDIFDDEKLVSIPLKSELSLNQNIERYFRKARGEKMKFENAKVSLSETRQKIVDLKAKLILFESMEQEQLKEFGKKTTVISREEKTYPNNARIRKFLIDGKWEVLVGKDSESNDVLTQKVAKQSDYWFHARGSSGSHTVLRFSGKDKPPKEIIKKVAQLAAFYSRAKNSKLVPVAYTQKKYVGKRKGMNPGQVLMLREEVVMVPPEIPVGCTQDNEDQ